MFQIRLFYPFTTLSVAGFCLFLSVVTACQPDHRPNSRNTVAAVDSVQFEHKVHAEYAQGFRISYHKNYKLLEILKPFQDQVDTLRYSLVPRELTEKVRVEDTQEIPVPIKSLVATSTTHIGLVGILGARKVVTAVAGADYVYDKEIRQRLHSGKITAMPQGDLNKEQILALSPDLVMISGGQSSRFDNYKVLRNAGVKVMVNSEWLETTPLGKAEWMKVMAALLNKEARANKEFTEIVERYRALKSKAKKIKDKPLVITNMPYKGAWFVPSGNSFMAQFLSDAGADYPWSGTEEAGGLRKSFEVVYKVGLDADIWINPGSAASKEDILAKDARLSDFKPFQRGAIYNNNKRLSKSGGNDFWESGVVHPDIILADLIKIFHPQILPDHHLYYYQKIE